MGLLGKIEFKESQLQAIERMVNRICKSVDGLTAAVKSKKLTME